MGIKTKLASLSIIKKVASTRRRNKEYNYDKKLFINNYSYSKENKNKTGYNMILISHSLEKGMSNEKPRPFGVEKTERLMSLIDRYESFENYKNDYAYIYMLLMH